MLTPAECAELESLRTEFGGAAAPLSAAERTELDSLRSEFGAAEAEPEAPDYGLAFRGGLNTGVASLLGLPMDTVKNVADILGRAATGTVATAFGRPDLAPDVIEHLPGDTQTFMDSSEGRLASRSITPPLRTRHRGDIFTAPAPVLAHSRPGDPRAGPETGAVTEIVKTAAAGGTGGAKTKEQARYPTPRFGQKRLPRICNNSLAARALTPD